MKKHILKVKTLLLGEPNSGKSSFIKLLKKENIYMYTPTFGIDFHIQKFIIDDDPEYSEYCCYFYDICGNNNFKSFVSSYYDNCPLALIFFKYNNNDYYMESDVYRSINKWIKSYIKYRPDGRFIIIENCQKTKEFIIDKSKIQHEDKCDMIYNLKMNNDMNANIFVQLLIQYIKNKVISDIWIPNRTVGVIKNLDCYYNEKLTENKKEGKDNKINDSDDKNESNNKNNVDNTDICEINGNNRFRDYFSGKCTIL